MIDFSSILNNSNLTNGTTLTFNIDIYNTDEQVTINNANKNTKGGNTNNNNNNVYFSSASLLAANKSGILPPVTNNNAGSNGGVLGPNGNMNNNNNNVILGVLKSNSTSNSTTNSTSFNINNNNNNDYSDYYNNDDYQNYPNYPNYGGSNLGGLNLGGGGMINSNRPLKRPTFGAQPMGALPGFNMYDYLDSSSANNAANNAANNGGSNSASSSNLSRGAKLVRPGFKLGLKTIGQPVQSLNRPSNFEGALKPINRFAAFAGPRLNSDAGVGNKKTN